MTKEEVQKIIDNMTDGQRNLFFVLMELEKDTMERVAPILTEWLKASNTEREALEQRIVEVMQ